MQIDDSVEFQGFEFIQKSLFLMVLQDMQLRQMRMVLQHRRHGSFGHKVQFGFGKLMMQPSDNGGAQDHVPDGAKPYESYLYPLLVQAILDIQRGQAERGCKEARILRVDSFPCGLVFQDFLPNV